MEETNLKIKSSTKVDRIPINEWMTMFKVSSKYVEPTPAPEGYFDIDRFKQNIKKGRILNKEN